MRDDIVVRRILPGDWDAIAELECRAYAPHGLSEGRAALRSRADAAPDTCLVVVAGRRVAGYVLALPYPPFRVPDLAAHERTAFTSTNLHLHDIVIAEDLRRRGLATRLVRHLTSVALARSHDQVSLVAVAGSTEYWAGNGFRPHPRIVVSGYGPHAVYMSKTIRTGGRP